MKAILSLCGALSLCLLGCGEKSTNSSGNTNASSGPSVITAPVDYLGAVGAAKTFAEKTVDLAQLNQAIQMFQAQESRYPTNFEELIAAKLLVQVPKAPYGKKLVYDASTGKVSIVNK